VLRRRRRTPEAARREIIEAAERLLRERPFRELTVDEVMRRTGLSRPSFYVYFKDRHELVLRMVEHIGGEILKVANRWYESDGGAETLREGLRGVAAVYDAHGPVLRALADAAVEDTSVEEAYAELMHTFVAVTTEHIVGEVAAGRISPVHDAHETSKALVWMTERYLYHSLGSYGKVSLARVLETLTAVWSRTLYS
jgi:AcrR family transcriptional regulator